MKPSLSSILFLLLKTLLLLSSSLNELSNHLISTFADRRYTQYRPQDKLITAHHRLRVLFFYTWECLAYLLLLSLLLFPSVIKLYVSLFPHTCSSASFFSWNLVRSCIYYMKPMDTRRRWRRIAIGNTAWTAKSYAAYACGSSRKRVYRCGLFKFHGVVLRYLFPFSD